MSTKLTVSVNSVSADATEHIASLLGARLQGGEVIVLVSDLGGGKTAFVRGLARGMGSTDHVASPTFTISREYTAGDRTLYHFDFYRLQEPGVVAAELEEFVHDPQAVVAIEWGEIVEGVLPDERVEVRIERTGESARRITITCPQSLEYVIAKELK